MSAFIFVRIPLSVSVLIATNKTVIWILITYNRDQSSLDPHPCSPENFLNQEIMRVNYKIIFSTSSSTSAQIERKQKLLVHLWSPSADPCRPNPILLLCV